MTHQLSLKVQRGDEKLRIKHVLIIKAGKLFYGFRDAYNMGRRTRKMKDSLGYKRYGRSLIRKSGRQPKKLFETFNEVEIQKTIERKHREMLALVSFSNICCVHYLNFLI